MPTPRGQQATIRNRRVTTLAQPTDTLNIPWILSKPDSDLIYLTFWAQGANAVANYPGNVVTGPPRVTVDGADIAWTLETNAPGFLALRAPADLPSNAVYRVFPFDPAVRSSLGGYLIPQITRALEVEVVPFLSASIADPNRILVQYDVGADYIECAGGINGYFPFAVPSTIPNAYSAQQYQTAGPGTLEILFSDDISGETQISLGSGPLVVTNTLRPCEEGVLDLT